MWRYDEVTHPGIHPYFYFALLKQTEVVKATKILFLLTSSYSSRCIKRLCYDIAGKCDMKLTSQYIFFPML